jgi:hypothetical protein
MPALMLNKYDGTYPILGKKSVMAADMQTASKFLFEQNASDPILLQRVEENVGVALPPGDVTFVTTILDEAAVTAGCQSFPSGHTLPAGSSQIFTAVAVDGWGFVGWYHGTTLLSADAEALLAIPTSTAIVTIEARFEAI